MKTDPNKICANQKENKGWAFVHDAIAHPLMALTGYHKLSLRFHNYTSHKAWPRKIPVEKCFHTKWAEESSENNWRSYCLDCGLQAQGSCQQ